MVQQTSKQQSEKQKNELGIFQRKFGKTCKISYILRQKRNLCFVNFWTTRYLATVRLTWHHRRDAAASLRIQDRDLDREKRRARYYE